MTDMDSLGVPWASLNIAESLDIMYYAHSANKIVSPIVRDYIKASDEEDGSLGQAFRNTLARIIVIKFNDKWTRLWDLGDEEYDPLFSDQITETETITGQHSKSGTNTGTMVTDRDSTDTGTTVTDHDRTDTGTITDQGSNSDNENLYGFNSSTAVGANTSNGTDSNTETRNIASSDDITLTRNLASSDDITLTRNLADSESGTESSSRTFTKNGRTGSLVSGTRVQDLIEAERNILQWNFWDVVFNDIDQVLALDIY